MIDSDQYKKLVSTIQNLFPVRFELVDNRQFGLEACYMLDQATVLVNSGFINHVSTGEELFLIYAMHEMAHFYGFSKDEELIGQTMINETWADYWAISLGLKKLFPNLKDWRRTLSSGIEQLKNYRNLEQPNQQEQIQYYNSSVRPEIHLPLDYRIVFYESLMNGSGFPDFICETRRKPH